MTPAVTQGGERNAPAGSAAPPSPQYRRRNAVIAIGLAIVWVGVLIALVARTANPVTLNRDQILRSHVIVEARVVDSTTGECEVVRAWPAAFPLRTITVRELTTTGAKLDQTYVLPLISIRDDFEITPTRLPNGVRLIYPATPEAVRQLEAILAQVAARAP